MKNYESCLVQIKIGDFVKEKESNRVGILKDIVLVPNGIEDTSLVALLYVQLKGGSNISATSKHFERCTGVNYEEFYPTPHLFKIETKASQ